MSDKTNTFSKFDWLSPDGSIHSGGRQKFIIDGVIVYDKLIPGRPEENSEEYSLTDLEIKNQDRSYGKWIHDLEKVKAKYIVDIPITYNVDFKRREPSVLKFISGNSNVNRSSFNFNLYENTKIKVIEEGVAVPGPASKYIIMDGTMRLKTEYQTPMSYDGVLEDGNLFSLNLTLSEEGVVSPEDFIGFINPTESREYKFKKILNLVN